MDTDAACRLIQKLRDFARTQLDADERALLAILLAPGIAQAYPDDGTPELAATRWSAQALPDALAGVLRSSGVHVVGLQERAGGDPDEHPEPSEPPEPPADVAPPSAV
ncbi:hypothetical protein [Actinopolymorpha alba]|uniref:hypothetical protein n=1 Tax=Actinopolymorpha alba TaxID=533267 RepID=UPI00037D059F|nr:hypothetical protein [Actinopolymorpha alba]